MSQTKKQADDIRQAGAEFQAVIVANSPPNAERDNALQSVVEAAAWATTDYTKRQPNG